ncbi:unnamed protein product [Pleuronectes platessa]|uniref:Uncharacterized protein n=1 Tax=Pleuronectes platessa TaxID=8262 RepID=A0A9N7V872_PLEPL|nr:unnamed protein product [Pleuronectes platessa]
MELRKYLMCLEFILLLKEFCQCFNIDVKNPRIFTGPEDALFGFSVLQHESNGEKSMLVGAPWDGPPNNRKGDVYKCIVGDERNSNCSKVNLGEIALQNVSKNLRNSHLGMTLTPDSPDGFLVRGLNTGNTGRLFSCFCYVGIGVICWSLKGCGEARLGLSEFE